MKTKTLFVSLFCALTGIAVNAQSVYPGQHTDKIKVQNVITVKAYSFNLKDVKLLESPFTENMQREIDWLSTISVNQLVHNFRLNAGIQTSSKGAMQGWERYEVELRGHTTGHVMSALALLYATTGDKSFKLKGDSVVSALTEVQTVLNQDGYLSAYPLHFIDRNIAGKGVWAPWYTLHKIYAGLIDLYLYTDNQEALDVVTKMGMWAYKKLSPLTDEQLATMLKNEFGGIGDALYNLYSITGIPKIKEVAQLFYHKELLDPLCNHTDNLAKHHANTFIPKIIAEARHYELAGGEKEKTITDFFWNTVIDHHTYATGGNSDTEHFFEADHIAEHLTGYTQESCNTYNMLKLTKHLFSWDPNPVYADYYENALYNHILGQQDPETGMISYFLPMLPGAHKVYSTPRQSFWCCVGTGFENHAKYGEGIYYHDNNALYVNLFIPSELNWKKKGIKVRQETKFPDEETISLFINTDAAVNMPLKLRYPSWSSKAEVKVNGKKISIRQKPGSYITIDRKWNKGDKIEVRFPMSVRTIAANDNPNKVAFAYGPLVLASPIGTEGMQSPAPYSNPALHNDYYTYQYNIPEGVNTTLKVGKDKPERALQPVAGEPLTFKVTQSGTLLKPISRIHRERYITYWDIEP